MGEVANETLEEMLASARRETEPRLGDSVRSVVKNVIHRAGIHSAVQQLWSGEAVVLFFHKIFPGPLGLWDEPVLSAEAFDQQLAFLTRNYEVVHLSELVRAIRGEAPFPSRAAVLTFDDGYRNNLLRAAPLLRRHRVPATLFVTSGLIGTEEWMWGYELEEMMFRYSVPQFGRAANDPFIHSVCARETSKYTALMVSVEYLKRLDDGRRREIVASLQRHLPVELDEDNRLLTWDEVRELREYGFELGAHTMTHPILQRVTPKQLEWEVAQSREVMERELGARPT